MPSAMTSWGQSQFLNICLNLQAAPTSFWVALATDEPGVDADGTTLTDIEPSCSAGFSRVEIALNPSTWTVADGTNYSTQTIDISFPPPSDSWGVINHFALCSADVNGEVYIYGEFDLPTAVDTTLPFTIPAGGIAIAFGSFLPSIVA